MRRILAIFTAIAICTAFSGCGSKELTENKVGSSVETYDSAVDESSSADNTESDMQKFIDSFDRDEDVGEIGHISESAELTGDNAGVRIVSKLTLNDEKDIYNNAMLILEYQADFEEQHGKIGDMDYAEEYRFIVELNDESIIDMYVDKSGKALAEPIDNTDYTNDFMPIIVYDSDKYIVTIDLNEDDLNAYKTMAENDLYILLIGGTLYHSDVTPVEKAVVYANIMGEDEKCYTEIGICTDGKYYLSVDEDFLREHSFGSCEIVGVLEAES